MLQSPGVKTVKQDRERCKIYMKSIEIYGTVTTIIFRGVKEAVCFIENGALLSFRLRELPVVDFCYYVWKVPVNSLGAQDTSLK